jgi:hypothetical protein
MPETVSNTTATEITYMADWKYKNREADTASTPVIAEEGGTSTIELAKLIPYIATYIEQYSSAESKKNDAIVVKLNMLETKRLRNPLDVIIEEDDEGFIARAVDFALFGYGDDRIEAIDALKFEIESLYFELKEDDNFAEEWLSIKSFLKESIIDSRS